MTLRLRRRNSDDRLRRLERKAQQTLDKHDIIAYWREALRVGVLPKCQRKFKDAPLEFIDLEDIEGIFLFDVEPVHKIKDQVNMSGVEVNIRYEENYEDGVGQNRYSLWVWRKDGEKLKPFQRLNSFRELQDAIKIGLEAVIRENDQENPGRRKRRNSDDKIRKLERDPTQIKAYWKELLRSGKLPKETLDTPTNVDGYVGRVVSWIAPDVEIQMFIPRLHWQKIYVCYRPTNPRHISGVNVSSPKEALELVRAYMWRYVDE